MAGFNLTEAERSHEKRLGLPSGILTAVRMQETGGNSKYWEKPDEYHYPLNAEGKRIAKHTGKVSTAFGPYGIVDSTAKQPGYSTAPLKGKNIEEQVRFAADYLAGRIKQAGSLEAGLGGYGEGAPYARKVLGRIGQVPQGPTMVESNGKQIPVKSPTLDAQRAYAQAGQVPSTVVPNQPYEPFKFDGSWNDVFKHMQAALPDQVESVALGEDPWVNFLNTMNQPVEVASTSTAQLQNPMFDPLAYGQGVPDLFAALNGMSPMDLAALESLDI